MAGKGALRIGISSKVDKPPAGMTVAKAISVLNENGIKPLVTQLACDLMHKYMQGIDYDYEECPIEDFDKRGVDFVIAIGGDGTVLNTFQHTKAPVLGINHGILGYLIEVTPDEVEKAISRLIEGDFFIDERVKLSVKLNGKRLPDCVNEVVVHSAQVAKIEHYQVLVAGEVIQDFRADGVIVSTPTGSTSYAMSCGGPVAFPKVRALVVVPISPFRQSSHPLVVPDDQEICVRLISKKRQNVVALDGQIDVELGAKDKLTMKRSRTTAKFVRFRAAARGVSQ